MKFRESDIRPDKLLKKQQECFDSDIRKLLKYKSKFVKVPCPACGSGKRVKKFDKYGFKFDECLKCGTVYVNPRPTPEILNIYYSTSEHYAYWNKYIFPASETARRKNIFRPRAERIVEICTRLKVPFDSILEAGAGFGTFCEEIGELKKFRKIVAVEPTPCLAETCRKRGLEVVESTIENAMLGEDDFSVVASFEVIEHLFDPKVFIRQAAKLLSPDGILVLTCPNVCGFEAATLQSVSKTFDTEHLNYFNPSSLSYLLKKCGFQVLEVQTPGVLDAELVRKQVLAGNADLSGQPFLRTVLMDEWERLGGPFQQFLIDNKLSTHMWIVAKKT